MIERLLNNTKIYIPCCLFRIYPSCLETSTYNRRDAFAIQKYTATELHQIMEKSIFETCKAFLNVLYPRKFVGRYALILERNLHNEMTFFDGCTSMVKFNIQH